MKRLNLKWIFIGVLLLVPMYLGVVWYVRQSSLNSQLEALKAEGMPTNLEELNDFYVVPEGVEDTTDLWLKAFDAVENADLFKRGKDLLIIGLGPESIPPPGEEWAEFEAARTLITELESELQALHVASDSGGQVRFPNDLFLNISTGQLSQNQSLRTAARLIKLATHVHSHDGDCDQSLRDVQTLYGLSNALHGEVAVISYLVRVAFHGMACRATERLLNHCDWSNEDLKSLQKTVRSASFRDELIIVFQGERAFSLSAIDQFPIGVLRAANKRELLRVFEETFAGLTISWVDAIENQRKLRAQNKAMRGNTISRMKFAALSTVLPSLKQVVISGSRAEAQQRCTNAAIAVRRYQLKHGALPESLEEIEQELLGPESEFSASLIDPFDGQPLRYIVEEDHVLIYSIGENEIDDGGDYEHVTTRLPLDVGFYLKK